MSDKSITDPLALMRATVDQWEKLANDFGSQFLQRPETSQAMQQMSAAYLQMQAMMQDAMAKALAAANMPSRADIEAISARLGAIEASIARIESGATGAARSVATPRPPRTRKPPARA